MAKKTKSKENDLLTNTEIADLLQTTSPESRLETDNADTRNPARSDPDWLSPASASTPHEGARSSFRRTDRIGGIDQDGGHHVPEQMEVSQLRIDRRNVHTRIERMPHRLGHVQARDLSMAVCFSPCSG